MPTYLLSKKASKFVSVFLSASLLLSLMSVPATVEAAEPEPLYEDAVVRVGNAIIGNKTERATNMFVNFSNEQLEGFSLKTAMLEGDDSGTEDPGTEEPGTEEPVPDGPDPDENIFDEVDTGLEGFTFKKWVINDAGLKDGTILLRQGGWVEFKIDVSKNETLRELAKSGEATVEMGWSAIRWNEKGPFYSRNYQGTEVTMSVIEGGVENRLLYERAYHGGAGSRKSEATITPNSIIYVKVLGIRNYIHDMYSGVEGMVIKFKDEKRPVLEDYTFSGNGFQRANPETGQQELYVKENEYIDFSYNFSEPVRPKNMAPVIGGVTPPATDEFLNHPLFVNPDGDGLPTQGQPQFLKSRLYAATTASLKKYYASHTYRYTGVRYHHSGNNPLEPAINGPTGVNKGQPLGEKLIAAELVDAAGNAAIIPYDKLAADGNSDPYLRKNTNNNGQPKPNIVRDPFDFRNGGLRVIVDGVRPKYTKTGNGIQPEILTGVTLNKNDKIQFTVQFTEEAMSTRGLDISKTFLHFNNGMRAYYTGGDNTKNWTFEMTVPKTVSLKEEVPLLKVIGLTNEAYLPENSGIQLADKNVVSDYAGNLLVQPANFFGEHRNEDGKDPSLVNSKIDWAQLSIDNTAPVIGFRFEGGGATDTVYQRNGKVSIDANDPVMKIPYLEVETNAVGVPSASTLRGEERPSKGVYRPSNPTWPDGHHHE